MNAHDRPLGLYYFGADKNEENEVTSRTISGGVTINDLLVHATQEGLPFGGVGASGMGAYKGIEGFKNFSHAGLFGVHARGHHVYFFVFLPASQLACNH